MGDEQDVTIKGANAIRSCDKIFLEMYTSLLGVDTARLEAMYGKPVVLADRDMVESGSDAIIEPAKTGNVAFLVVGDALWCVLLQWEKNHRIVCYWNAAKHRQRVVLRGSATTHTDMAIRALDEGVDVRVIHNASIMNAVGVCGLQLYNYGQTVSIPFFTEDWKPDSFYDKIKFNSSGGLHTLCLLDIKVKEPDFEAMVRGVTKFLPPRFMTVNTAVEQLLEIEERRGEGVLSEESLGVGIARIGQEDQLIAAGTLAELREHDFGEPLHSLVIVGTVHELENEMLRRFRIGSGLAVPRGAPTAPAQAEGE